jgi:hypothetical protein
MAGTSKPAIAAHSGAAGPLAPEHLRELAEARNRSKKIRRAATVASMSGWTMAIFAVITLVGAVFGDIVSLVLGVGLAVITYNELRGGGMLRRFEPAGAKRLAMNQIALGVLIVGYAIWSLLSMLRTPVLAQMGGSTGDPDMDAMVQNISGTVAYALYGGMGFVGIIVPGLTAWYYYTRGRLVRAMLRDTPPWVIEMLKVTG